MNSKVINYIITLSLVIAASCNDDNLVEEKHDPVHLFRVPSDYSSINVAVHSALAGDTILLAPGTYNESNITVDRAVIITSEWKITGDTSIIRKTIINAGNQVLFEITKPGAEISGLKIINGDHTLSMTASTTVKYCQFINNLDALSFETGSGGYAGYNTIMNDKDDGMDLDIGEDKKNLGSDIIIENNSIVKSHDDGIEIRLFTAPSQNITYTIRGNTITGSTNAGIQLISYDVNTGKVFHIHHNIFKNCKTGLGCMEGANTDEDLTGASKMDEIVWFYNNTMTGNQMGATGSNKIIAFNNLVFGNVLGGFKHFGQYSVIKNNLFYNNSSSDLIDINASAAMDGNIQAKDPVVDGSSLKPLTGSPCINAGISLVTLAGGTILTVPVEYIYGAAPDIGAVEWK